ncbi:Putative ribosomal N-acetyltransferase YdaF [Poriferisphaera corsica]|uniref:Ribosomal N-acetyltransferase YdaF n=1 Tax=Poriferisphaera corsica TaxID=2528020 RepID=A0A517YS91_9BACT|nr:GNAT family protein [Poriferisphaera corsica]QDU33084.1 Putative ribosomal N-acetyltransferase YdaF [Poriferisphaera corsica]
MRLKVNERTNLELVEKRHAAELSRVVLANDEDLSEWFLWADKRYGVDTAERFIEKAMGEFKRREAVYMVILHDEKIVGEVGFESWRELENQEKAIHLASAEMTYWLTGNARGRGLMREVIRTMLAYGFNEMGLMRVVIQVEPNNLKSCRVAELAGFVYEGCQRGVATWRGRRVDLNLYAMTNSDWGS